MEWKFSGQILSWSQIRTYKNSGILVWEGQFFDDPQEWESIKKQLLLRLDNRPPGTKYTSLQNLKGVFKHN